MSQRISRAAFLVIGLAGGAAFGQCEPIALETPAYVSQGCVMLPVRALFEWLGAEQGQAGAAPQREAHGARPAAVAALAARYGEHAVRLQEGDRFAVINGAQVPIDGRPGMEESRVELRDGELFVPLAFLAGALKLNVKWDTAAGGVATLAANGREAAMARFPLIWAAAHGRLDTLTRLLDRGAEVNVRTASGGTALHWAARQGQRDAARLLIDRGGDVHARCKLGGTPLHWATSAGRTAVAQLLIDRNAGISPPDEEGETPLHWAARQGQAETIHLLLQHGADVQARSKAGWTPLHAAAANAGKDLTEPVRLLLDSAAEVNARDGEQKSPLHWAACQGHTEVARLLLDRGADARLRCRAGWTPLDWATRTGRVETAQLLRERAGDDD